MLAVDALVAERELVTRGLPFVIWEQRVVTDRCRERALGEAEDDHEVEVEPDAHRDRADEDAVAEAADASEVGLELERERAREHVEADRAFDVVEGREPVERGLDPLGGLAFGVGPAFAACGAAE